MNNQPISQLFVDNIDVLPLWVKQVLYLKTRDKIKEQLVDFVNVLAGDNLVQYFCPKITLFGEQELKEKAKNLSLEYYTFLDECLKGHSLFEITLSNYWTFAQTCTLFVRLMDMQLVELPSENQVVVIAHFLSGKVRTGEMLKGLGKIDAMQLEKAVRIQRERNASGDNIKMATLLVELGYINEEGIRTLLNFKEDAKMRFVMGVGFSLVKPKNEIEAKTLVDNMQKEIKRLDEENRILKNRLRKILNIKE